MQPNDLDNVIARVSEAAQDLSGQRILITGGLGFIGSHLVSVFQYLNDHVLSEPMQLTVVDNLVTGRKPLKQLIDREDTRVLMADAADVSSLPDLGHIDLIIHAAGIASPYYYRAHPLETLDVATRGTRALLDLAVQNRARFVFFSSSEIYGDPDEAHIPIPESYRGNVATMGPRACYDEGKRVGETLCYIYHEYFGIHTNCIRPFNVFGPGMPEKDYRVMPNFASSLIGGRALTVYGDGRQTRTFCYLTDALVGFILVMTKGVPGEPYNIGNPDAELTMSELAKLFQAIDPSAIVRTIEYPDSYPADEPRRRVPDTRKAQMQLGYNSEVDISQGLEEFVGWARANYTGKQ